MSGKLKGTLIGLACLICCIPLIFTVAGATTGIAGTVSVWTGRYDLAITAALGLGGVIIMAVRRNRTSLAPKVEEHWA